mgnify:CR=1 FL=1
MPQSAIKRNFLTVNQIAERQRPPVAARTVLHWIATGQLTAEPLDPDRPASDKIVAIAEVERFEQERAKE